MKIEQAEIDGLFVLNAEPVHDERGAFARIFDRSLFVSHDLCVDFPEHSVASNYRRGVLRGLHYQAPPHQESKVIRCTRGRIFDVILDVRLDSPTYGCWKSFELIGGGNLMLYVGAGLAHGYQALEDDSDVHYLISAPYAPQAARGVRFNDPSLAIPWPIADPILSERDWSHPLLSDAG